MSGTHIDCPLCGHHFVAHDHAGCSSCPMGASCATVCCPACGYSTIDVTRTSLAARLARLFQKKSSTLENAIMTLNDVAAGDHAQIAGFSDDLPNYQREHLQAYGLVEGRPVRVLQHSPATVVRIEHLELALEAELAGKVRVTGERVGKKAKKWPWGRGAR